MSKKGAYRVVDEIIEMKWRDGTLRVSAMVGREVVKYSLGPALAAQVLNQMKRAMAKAEVVVLDTEEKRAQG